MASNYVCTLANLLLIAQSTAQRRGQLLGYFLGSVLILIVGVFLVIRNRKK